MVDKQNILNVHFLFHSCCYILWNFVGYNAVLSSATVRNQQNTFLNVFNKIRAKNEDSYLNTRVDSRSLVFLAATDRKKTRPRDRLKTKNKPFTRCWTIRQRYRAGTTVGGRSVFGVISLSPFYWVLALLPILAMPILQKTIEKTKKGSWSGQYLVLKYFFTSYWIIYL